MPAEVMQRAPSEPPIPLAEVYHLRDLGGVSRRRGGEVRRGMVYCGDDFERARGADLDLIRGLGLRTVIDLRTPEQVAQGRLAVAEIGAERFHHLPLLPSREEASDAGPELDPVRVEGYVRLLEDGGPAVALALWVLADPSAHPVVLHGAAGQDRTALLAAVLLSVLGVDAGRASAAGREARSVGLGLAELARRHGSVSGYCRSAGVSEEILERLVRLLTLPR